MNTTPDTIPEEPDRWNEPGQWVLYSPDDNTYLMYTHPPIYGQGGCAEWVEGIHNAHVFRMYCDLCIEAWQWQDPVVVRLL